MIYSRILTISSFCLVTTFRLTKVAYAETSLNLVYPPPQHSTTATQIFFIGTAPSTGEVFINDQIVKNRSNSGHFAPSFPLEMGENKFVVRYQNEIIERVITRIPSQPEIPPGEDIASNSLTPSQDISRLPGDLVCFGIVASPGATATVTIGDQKIPLSPQVNSSQLLPNSAIYTTEAESWVEKISNHYQGCTIFSEVGFWGHPLFNLTWSDRSLVKQSEATVRIIPTYPLEVVVVSENYAVTRTGPSTSYSRLTPLPQGTKAAVTAKEGEWLRLDYGAWVKAAETRLVIDSIPPKSMIRAVKAQTMSNATEIIFPLQMPIPISIQQNEKSLSLTLHNTIAQTDTIRFDDHPWLKRLDWQQTTPDQVQYTLHFKTNQQWGYDYRYEQSNLILTIKHPPVMRTWGVLPLENVTILLDPGHGGSESGAVGPNGYPEKDINLIIAQSLASQLTDLGAKVVLTRETDVSVSLSERVEMIREVQPAIALSLHYNALPDEGDALNTAGISTFWYHPQAHDLAVFLHNHLVNKLSRPSYGVYWNNLALTRPHTAPTVLLELGFMINPDEFEWIMDSRSQAELTAILADGIVLWLQNRSNFSSQ